MSRIVNIVIDEIRAAKTTEDSIFNDRDEVYFVLAGAVARAKTLDAEAFYQVRRPAGNESDNDYWGLHNGEHANNIKLLDRDLELHPGDVAYVVVAVREQDNAQLKAIWKTVEGVGLALSALLVAAVFGTDKASAEVIKKLLEKSFDELLEAGESLVNSLSSDGDQTIGAFDVRIANQGEKIAVAIGGVTDVGVVTSDPASAVLDAHGSDAVYAVRASVTDTLGTAEQPLTEKRKGTSHSGSLVQSTFGRQGNFELFVSQGNQLVHFFRDNDAPGLPWHKGATLYDATPFAVGPSLTTLPFPGESTMIQSNFSDPGNLEAIVRMSQRIADARGDTLGFFFMDHASLKWSGPYAIIVDGEYITGVTGNPALIESTLGKDSNNFEMLVPRGNRLVHYFRDNGVAGSPWHSGGELPMPAAGGGAVPLSPTSVALLQSNFNDPGNLEAIVRFTPSFDTGTGDSLAFYFRDAKTLQWSGPDFFKADGQPITGVTGRPAFIQGAFGQRGNFELLVPQGNRTVHYFRDNDSGLVWHKGGELPIPVGGQGAIALNAVEATLIQSNFNSPGNLEAIVRMSPVLDTGQGDTLFFYFLDSSTLRWSQPAVVTADGQAVQGAAGI